MPLGFSFPFLGKNYSSIFVNSDGNIAFGAGDSAALPRGAARTRREASQVRPHSRPAGGPSKETAPRE